ncbi:MAG: hypothetical protein O2779_05195 [Nanoarchaeota archaeon]|nr:hypothetical protein [Nanoarchaeota archaeon]
MAKKSRSHVLDTSVISSGISKLEDVVENPIADSLFFPDIVLREILEWCKPVSATAGKRLHKRGGVHTTPNPKRPISYLDNALKLTKRLFPLLPQDGGHYLISEEEVITPYTPNEIILQIADLTSKSIVHHLYGNKPLNKSYLQEVEAEISRYLSEIGPGLPFRVPGWLSPDLGRRAKAYMLRCMDYKKGLVPAENKNDALIVSAAFDLSAIHMPALIHTRDSDIATIVNIMKSNDTLFENVHCLEVYYS